MESQKKPLYPQVIESNPESSSPLLSNPSRSSLYPSLDMADLVKNLFPDADDDPKDRKDPDSSLPRPIEETLIRVPGAILHLVDRQSSVELATGDFDVLRLRQGDNAIAVMARIGDVQWPLARDAAVVRLDGSHYFFSLRVPPSSSDGGSSPPADGEDVLSYGLTFASKGQERALDELDGVLDSCCSFSRHKVRTGAEVLDGSVAKEVTPAEVMEEGPKKKMMEERSAAYWTTLAPNVEDYSGSVAKVIAKGSGQLIKGILWCGDVTVDRLKWGNEMMKNRMGPRDKPAEISPQAMRRIKRFDLYNMSCWFRFISSRI